MKCYKCGGAGTRVGKWRTIIRKLVWVTYQCDNPACEFEYRTFDGETARARPTWMHRKRAEVGRG